MSEKSLLPLLRYIIGMYDPYGVGHSARVKDLCLRLATRCGIESGSQEMKDLETAADLHDIGKLGIPESIRRLPGKFLPMERMLMEQHAVIGEKLLKLATNGLVTPEVCRIVRHHHENWNGSGYPEGLKGAEIPLGSRIIRICDFYDALINVRGYQNPMQDVAALQYMSDEQIDRRWADPEMFRLFLEMIRN